MDTKRVETSGSDSSPRDDKTFPHSAELATGSETYTGYVGSVAVIDHHAERALCRKFDYRLMPVLALMYLFNALDKGNLGNAKTAGLEKDLGFKNNQYNIILSVFYVPYVLFAPILVRHYPSVGQYEVNTLAGYDWKEIWPS